MDENQVTIWMARDENGKLAVYDSKPDKYEKMKVWMPHGRYDNYIHVSPDLFPSVKWEDAEPTEVVLTLKNSETLRCEDSGEPIKITWEE